jgi:hypothetical protein
VGEELNPTTARKPGPLQIIQYSLRKILKEREAEKSVRICVRNLKNWEEEGGGVGGKTICPLSENLNVRFPAGRQIVLQKSQMLKFIGNFCSCQ